MKSAGLVRLPGPHAGLRIGLLGGSFNPAHSGHRLVAEAGLKRLGLDAVWWIVARGNPLKMDHGRFADRFASAQTVAAHPKMRVTEIEALHGLTYTADTLATLKARAPLAHFVWLMGADNLQSFHFWRDWQSIAEMVPIAVIARPGAGPRARNSVFARRYASARLPEVEARRLPLAEAPAWVYLKGPVDPVSSTALRAAKINK